MFTIQMTEIFDMEVPMPIMINPLRPGGNYMYHLYHQ
jgi:hypothetical protein